MEKIKVLHLVNSVNLGGGARAVRTLYAYAPKNIEIHVVSIIEKGEKYDEFSKICRNLVFVDNDLDLTVNYIKENKIQILHFHTRGVYNEFEKMLIRKVKNECKIICTNIFGEFETESDSLTNFYIFKSFHAFTQKFAKFAGLDLRNISNLSSRYYVLPNPVDFKLFEQVRPSKSSVAKYKQKIGVKSSDLVIGKIGSRKAIEKWSDLLLYMFPEVLKKNPNTVMLLQGVPDNRLPWVNKFGDRIKIIENTNDEKMLAILYNSLDIFIHASKIGEHSGNSINEAMFWAKPVIVNLTPDKDNGQFEQVKDSVTGYFANDTKTFSSYVIKLLSNNKGRVKLGNAGEKLIRSNNNPEIISNKMCDIYCYTLGLCVLDEVSFQNELSLYLNNYNQLKLMVSNFTLKERLTTLYFKFYDFSIHKGILKK